MQVMLTRRKANKLILTAVGAAFLPTDCLGAEDNQIDEFRRLAKAAGVELKPRTLWFRRGRRIYDLTDKQDARLNLRSNTNFFYVGHSNYNFEYSPAHMFKSMGRVRDFDGADYSKSVWLIREEKNATPDRRFELHRWQHFHRSRTAENSDFEGIHFDMNLPWSYGVVRTDDPLLRHHFAFSNTQADDAYLRKQCNLFKRVSIKGLLPISRYHYEARDFVTLDIEAFDLDPIKGGLLTRCRIENIDG